jgi:UDP-N-acetyl-D-mannosaminuronic acid dehydrogenase
MVSPKPKFDVCVIGGAGHVGAPLAIVLASHGFQVLIHDLNRRAMDTLAGGQMPFLEKGGEDLLRRVLDQGRLGFSDSPESIRGIPTLILTIGTPIDEFHNPLTSLLLSCLDTLLPHIADGSQLILRSTVAPGTTTFLDLHLKKKGRRLPLAFCPERVVQGRAIEEIQTLSQIISGTSPAAIKAARRIFSKVASGLVEMTPLEAEYAKLICNAYRYIQFAATNQLYMIVQEAGLDYTKLLEKVMQGYPRMGNIPGPGFAAGPCLMKDTMQLFAFGKHNFILGQVAMTINEGLPNFIIERLQQDYDLSRTKVGILGMAFKAESDDIRDSLSYKLGKLLRFHGAEVFYSDEFVSNPTFISKEKLVRESEVVIVGAPHSAYRKLRLSRGKKVIDLWGIFPKKTARRR